MVTGILYSSNDMLCHALKCALAQKGIKLVDFAGLSELTWQLWELQAQFVLLDADLTLGKAERNLLQQGQIPLFCLGKNLGWGQWVSKPVNPWELAQRLCALNGE